MSRCETNACSWQSVPLCGNTQRSAPMPSRPAAPAEHMITAAAMSTSLLEFMHFVYGSPTMRFVGDGVRMSTADLACRDHAFGLAAATSLKCDHISLMTSTWAAGLLPLAARIAVSNIG